MQPLISGILLSSIAIMGAAPSVTAQTALGDARLQNFHPLPAFIANPQNPVTERKIQLGRMLYYDPRLSANQKISCNSCHNLNRYGADEGRVSVGFRGQAGARNSPTVYNAAGHIAQFWDGRAPDVETQAKGPVMNPVEMAMTSQDRVVVTLNSIPEYVELFKRAFPGDPNPVTFDNVGSAIGVFERGLVTPGRWDKYLAGDAGALTVTEKIGFDKFYGSGCANCHTGTYLGGSQYQRLGLVKAWPETHDPGRFAVTGKEIDRGVFKVPSLRNVEKTAPYYHDGSVPTLRKAIQMMAEYQVGKALSQQDIASIEAFLKSLTGEIPVKYIKPPVLPKSTAGTPKPITD
jgi:cytochrome c peroxidase